MWPANGTVEWHWHCCGFCFKHQMNCHGMNNNNPQPSTSWQNGMGQHPNGGLSPSLALTSNSGAMSNGAAQYHSNNMSLLHSPVQQNPGFPVQQQFSQHSPAIMNLNSQFQQDPQGSFHEAATSMDFEYDPELGETENPHYFHINHVLFNAHCQRLRRDGYPSDPDPASFSWVMCGCWSGMLLFF